MIFKKTSQASQTIVLVCRGHWDANDSQTNSSWFDSLLNLFKHFSCSSSNQARDPVKQNPSLQAIKASTRLSIVWMVWKKAISTWIDNATKRKFSLILMDSTHTKCQIQTCFQCRAEWKWTRTRWKKQVAPFEVWPNRYPCVADDDDVSDDDAGHDGDDDEGGNDDSRGCENWLRTFRLSAAVFFGGIPVLSSRPCWPSQINCESVSILLLTSTITTFLPVCVYEWVVGRVSVAACSYTISFSHFHHTTFLSVLHYARVFPRFVRVVDQRSAFWHLRIAHQATHSSEFVSAAHFAPEFIHFFVSFGRPGFPFVSETLLFYSAFQSIFE